MMNFCRCGHCERLKPTWAELASTVQSNLDEKVVIAEVDCTTATSLCSQQDVTGYPTYVFTQLVSCRLSLHLEIAQIEILLKRSSRIPAP